MAQAPEPLAHVVGTEAAARAILVHWAGEELEGADQGANADLLAALHLGRGDVVEEDRLTGGGVMRGERERVKGATSRDQAIQGAELPGASGVHAAVDAFVVPDALEHAREPGRKDHRRHRLTPGILVAGVVEGVDT